MKKIESLKATIDFNELSTIAELAAANILQVRSSMLAPTAKKSSPVFSSQELAELCSIDQSKIQYLTKKMKLPQGEKIGNKLHWTLENAQVWVRYCRKEFMRNTDSSAAVVITIANFKGGVSKTTTAATLAQGLSLKGHRCLLIDADPQGSLSTIFGYLPDIEVEEEHTLIPLCTGTTSSIIPSIRKTYWHGIDIVTAAPFLFNAEFILPARQKNDKNFEFWRVLDAALDDAKNEYDVIIIDTAPSLSYLTINALMAANGIIMPMPPSAMDFASSAQFWSLFTDVCNSLFLKTGDNKKYNFIDILLSRVDNSASVSAAVRKWIISTYGSRVLPVEIPKTSIATTSAAEFGTVYDINPSSVQAKTLKRARDAYDSFVEHIEFQALGVWNADVDYFDGLKGQIQEQKISA